MKKFLSLLLALTMVLSLGTVVFAADDATVTSVTEGSNTASIDITATANVTGGNYADIAYSVKVEWTVGALELDIDNTELYTWDAATLKYVKAIPAAANFETKTVDATITLTNSSNAAVNYAIAYADNNTDNLTTSEEAKTGDKTGKLDNADTTTAASAADEESGHDYAIDTTKVTNAGEVKTASYTGTVSLTALGDTSAIENGGTIKLGTYTVTLTAAPTFSTIADIIATVPNFPTTDATGWKAAENPEKLVYTSTGYTTAVVIASSRILLSTPVTQEDSNYKAVYTMMYMSTTVTFFMTNNKLTSITATIVNSSLGTTETYTFTAPTT